MKLLPARYIIEESLKSGVLTKDMTVIESSSGTFALGLALVCAKHKLPLIIVGDPAIDDNLKRKLEILGAQVEIVLPEEGKGIQNLRLEKLNEIRKANKNTFWPQQYDNNLNTESYKLVADKVLSHLDTIDCLVGPVGSGGSVCGISNYIREKRNHLHVIGVDTHGSILFGQKDGVRHLRGLGNSVLPKNVNHSVFNEVHWVNAPDAYLTCKEMYRNALLYMGGTSGAAYLVGKWWAEKNPKKKVVIILPDEGHRYVSTIFNDDWLKEQNLYKKTGEISEPVLVEGPLECEDQKWSYMQWNKRNIKSVEEKNIVCHEE
ncbi:cysteine synthase family protein [Kordia antarctica]|nr:cysteine synthase family protein [Kordia antarctica]